jgi:hypothetical protein
MIRSFIVLVLLVGIGFVAGVSQAEVIVHMFPVLFQEAPIDHKQISPLVRCANQVATHQWKTFRSEHLGIIFQYPTDYAVTEKSESVEIHTINETGSTSDEIILQRVSGSFKRYVDDSMQQGGWKIKSRRVYALTTSFYSDQKTGQLLSKYLFIKNFPQHGTDGSYIMMQATLFLGSESRKLFERARNEGIVDAESLLTMPEQILSTFRFIEFDERKGME